MPSLENASKEANGLQRGQHASFPLCCVKLCSIIFDVANAARISVTQLRGFFGNLFIADPEFHHHSDKAYHYPLVQYKKVDGCLIVLGLQNYAELLAKKIAAVDVIATSEDIYLVRSKRIRLQAEEIVQQPCYYEFVTPWLALNEVNYSLFRTLSKGRKRRFLERILVANVLSCLKGLGIRVDFRVKANIYQYKALCVRVHGNLFVGFLARFRLNILIPELIGLGKSVSKGYGVIRRINL